MVAVPPKERRTRMQSKVQMSASDWTDVTASAPARPYPCSPSTTTFNDGRRILESSPPAAQDRQGPAGVGGRADAAPRRTAGVQARDGRDREARGGQ